MHPYEDDSGGEPPLRRLVHVVRRRWIVVVVVAALTMAATLSYGFTRSEVYEATSEILVRGTSTASQPGASQALSANPERLMETELQLIESRSTRMAVEAATGESISVSAAALGDSDVIEVTVQGGDPDLATAQVATFTETYLDLRRQDEVESLEGRLEAKEQTRRAARRDLRSSQSALDDIDARLAALPPGPAREALRQQRDTLAVQTEARIGSLQSYVAGLDDEIRQIEDEVADAGGGLAAISVAEGAAPVTPTPARGALVGGLMGLLGGVGAAFVREQFDDSIRNVADLERSADGHPVIGVIPRSRHQVDASTGEVVIAVRPDSPDAEAYRNLTTSLAFVMQREDIHTIAVTSPGPGDGKTTTVANLGVAFARTGRRVLIVDADFRRQRLNRVFGFRPTRGGLATALDGQHDPLDAILSPEVGIGGSDGSLGLLQAGPAPRSPVELLESPNTPKVLARLQEEADIILIDTPPVLPVADALVLAQHVDATVIVCAAGSTGRDRMTQALAGLRAVEARVLGTVLNKVTWEAGHGEYGY